MNFGSGFQVDMGWRPQGDQPPPLNLGAIGTTPRGNSDRGKWTAFETRQQSNMVTAASGMARPPSAVGTEVLPPDSRVMEASRVCETNSQLLVLFGEIHPKIATNRP